MEARRGGGLVAKKQVFMEAKTLLTLVPDIAVGFASRLASCVRCELRPSWVWVFDR